MAHVTIYDEKQTRGSISNNGLWFLLLRWCVLSLIYDAFTHICCRSCLETHLHDDRSIAFQLLLDVTSYVESEAEPPIWRGWAAALPPLRCALQVGLYLWRQRTSEAPR
jgi:hypothetical protein